MNFLLPFGLKPKKPVDQDGPRYADANDRCMAAALDIVVVFTLIFDISMRITHWVYESYQQAPPDMQNMPSTFAEIASMVWETREPWLIANGLIVCMIGVLLVGCQTVFGNTPGKQILGLRVVRAGTLEAITGWRYVLRFFAYIPSCLPLMLGVFWMSFNKQRRAAHDYIAGTAVINTRPRGWAWNWTKQAARWVWSKCFGSRTVEDAVGKPAATQRHEDGDKPIS